MMYQINPWVVPAQMTATALELSKSTMAMGVAGLYFWRLATAVPVLTMQSAMGWPLAGDAGVMSEPAKPKEKAAPPKAKAAPVKEAAPKPKPAPVAKAAPKPKVVSATPKPAPKPVAAKPEPAKTKPVSAAPKADTSAAPSEAPKSKPKTEVYQAKSVGSAKTAPVTLAAMPDAPKAKPAPTKAKAGKPDDLKAISGIGPKLEKQLNGMGITHYAQIAAFTAKDLAWVDEQIGAFKGRPKRDDWVGQAKALSAPKGA